MNIHKNTDWLLVFYIHEIPEYVIHSGKLLQLIAQCNMAPHSEVWVLLDKIVPITEKKVKFQLQTFQLQLAEEGSALREIPLQDFGIKPGRPGKEVLEKILSRLYQKKQSKRKMLFTWSHGAGFGINVGEWEEDQMRLGFSPKQKNHVLPGGIVEIKSSFHYLAGEEVQRINSDRLVPVILPVELASDELQVVLKEPDYNCTKAEILWMSDLATILRAALAGQKLDIMVLMNCNMQLFENGFMLREITHFLVGPESLMWFYGYNYAKLLSTISARPEISNPELCRSIVADYIVMHKQLGHHDYLHSTTMFANALEPFERIAGLLESTTKELLVQIEKVKPEIERLRAEVFYSVSGRNHLFLLDLSLWMKTICQTPALGLTHWQLYEQFKKEMDAVGVARHIGEGFIENDERGPKLYGHSGSALFFPHSDSTTVLSPFSWCEYFSRQRSSAFQDATSWEEFILALLQKTT